MKGSGGREEEKKTEATPCQEDHIKKTKAQTPNSRQANHGRGDERELRSEDPPEKGPKRDKKKKKRNRRRPTHRRRRHAKDN